MNQQDNNQPATPGSNAAARFQPPYKTVVFTTKQRDESFAVFKERVRASLVAQGILKPRDETKTGEGDKAP
jgi:hypothetical protein